MEAKREVVDSKTVTKRRRKELMMSFKVVHQLLLWRRKAKRTSLLKKEEEKMKRLVAKMKAETNRFGEFNRKVKENLKEIGIKIAKKRENNKMVLEDNEHIRRQIDLTLDIIDAPKFRLNSLTHNLRDMMAQQNEVEVEVEVEEEEGEEEA